jgi:hypothetical protein
LQAQKVEMLFEPFLYCGLEFVRLPVDSLLHLCDNLELAFLTSNEGVSVHNMLKLKNFVCACMTVSILQPVFSAETCPRRDATFLSSVEVFDGTPEELAMLKPDEGGDSSGYWILGYVYDQKRSVTVLCKYANGNLARVDLTQRVSKCNYQINKKNQLSFQCK